MNVEAIQAFIKSEQANIDNRRDRTIILCNSALGYLKLPPSILKLIVDILNSYRRQITRANKQIAKEYEEQKIAEYRTSFSEFRWRNNHIPTHYFQKKMNELNALFIIDTFFQYYQYALTVAPPYVKDTSLIACKQGPNLCRRMRRAKALKQRQIELLLALLLDIFSDGDFTDKHPSHKEVDRTRNGRIIKNLITDTNSFYVKLGAIKSLISIFNSSILTSFNIPEIKHTYTHININGSNTVIPIPMTLEVYLGLAAKQLQKL